MSDDSAGARRPGSRAVNRSSFVRRHPVITWALVLAIVIPLGSAAAYVWHLNNTLNSVPKVKVTREDVDPDEGRALNILMLGSDKGKAIDGQPQDTSIAEDAAATTWPAGKYRSDTLMLVHISADRKHVYISSIPRDSFVPIYDGEGNTDHSEKINAAFSMYGPLGAMETVEKLTGLSLDHLAIIDWAGFKDLSTAVGGVEVTIPTAFYDPKQKVQWEAGTQTLKGNKALQYVRTRYGLIGGDFDRIKRQQNFLRSLMSKMLSSGVTRNPVKLSNTVTALAENLTIDSNWSSGELRGLALSMRSITTDDVVFTTAPVGGERTDPTWGSVQLLDEVKLAELVRAMTDDTMDAYIEKYPDDVLPDTVR